MLYEETQRGSAWLIITALVLIALGGWLIMTGLTTDDGGWRLVSIGIIEIAAFVFVFFNFLKMKIVISESELDVSYGWFHHKIPLAQIKAVAITDLKFRNTGGIGIRLTPDGTTIYNTRWGQGIMIARSDTSRKFAFTTDNPEQILNTLQNNAKK